MASDVVAAILWIGSLLIQEANTLIGVENQVQALKVELEFMQQYLQDADSKKEVREVHTLIGQIRKLAYDAEDIIDTYILTVSAPVKKHRLRRISRFLHKAPDVYKIGKEIQLIQSEVQKIMGKLNSYGVRRIAPELREGFRELHNEGNWRAQPVSYPYDDNNHEFVVGLEKDVSKLLEVLVGDKNTDINVVSIVGMGGCGKTTLTRKLYNHPFVKECFSCMAWVFISQEWSTLHILSEILRKVGGLKETSELNAKLSAQELVDKLHSILKEKLYLVVLDDVWRREALEEILPALPWGSMNRGSKIVITTRNREIIQVQNLQQYLYIHEPEPLTEVESWELFSEIALNHRTNCRIENFESLGKVMLNNCGGLPLAIVALAGILNARESIGQWQQVSEAVRSRVMEDKCTKVHNLLAVSYDDLPNYLKPCFLYLSVFPEDCQIPAGMLTRMWIAEGLVGPHEVMSLEDVAMQHLEELSQRFMIQVVRTNYKGVIKAFQLHDLLRDLCLKKAKEQSFLHIYTAVSDEGSSGVFELAIQPRRAAFHSSFCLPTQASNLRSLVLLARSSILDIAYVSKETTDLRSVHQNFKLLRLLNLRGIKTATGTLPMQIGSLIHLRYIGLRASNITELPMSIGNLRNLYTLDYRNIDSDNNALVKIPNVFSKLEQLRHLFLPVEHSWSAVDLSLSSMKYLQILSGIKQNVGDLWLPRELSRLSTTLKKLKIVVSTEKELKAAFSCPSLMHDRLQTFNCELGDGLIFEDVECISNRQRLHKLILTGLIRMKLSLILPANLIMLELKDSMLRDEDPMVALGTLPHLRLLRLINFFAGITLIGEPGSFPQLEELSLESLQNLKSWRLMIGAMPCLRKLEIISCPFLRELPQGLEFLSTLQELEYFDMPSKFRQQAINSGWIDYDLAPDVGRSSCLEKHWNQKRRSYPYEDNEGNYVIGLEDDIQNLVQVLSSEEHGQVQVLSITGFGGSGKTTLARKLYNHPFAKVCFNCMVWVFVSQEWSIRHILSQILRKVVGPKKMSKLQSRLSVEGLVDKLRSTLKDKSYLIVLDDVWKKEALEEILTALPWGSSNRGSKIIITTRNLEITELQQHLYVHRLRSLSEKDSWALFTKIAPSTIHTYRGMVSFARFGKKMLMQCDGLPLAIVALAEIFSEGKSIEELEQMNVNVRSKIMEYTCKNMFATVGELLALSYEELPNYLKPLFLYLGLFPEECEIPAGMLIRMWIAEDLVPLTGKKSAEDEAMQLLEELHQRSMIQVVRTDLKGSIKAIYVPNLLCQLCSQKAEDDNYLQIYTSFDDLASKDDYAVSTSCKAALHSSLSFPTQVSNLRSLVVLTRSSILPSAYVSKETLDLGIMHRNFKLLRLLNLWGIKTLTGLLPQEIGSLMELRYLGIRASNITELPTSVGNLRNLLTLDYRNIESDEIVKIPNVLYNLILLRHLFLPMECSWSLKDLKLNTLRNLRVLWGVKSGRSEWFSREVSELSTSVSKLKVIVSTKRDLAAAFSCPSLMSDELRTFHCEWRDGIALQHVNGGFSHKKNLHKLELFGIIEVEKLSLLLPSNLVKLVLKDSSLQNEDSLIAVGQLAHLKLLKLSNAYLGTEFICKIGSFPVLEELYLECLPNLNTCNIESGAMLCLKKLVIINCKVLHNFPNGLPVMANLEELEFVGAHEKFCQITKESCGWSKQSLATPHNFDLIVPYCDSVIDLSCNNSLWQQLMTGVDLNNKKQKFWVMKQNERYNNCFMLYATHLSPYHPDMSIENPFGMFYMNDNDDRWLWNQTEETYGQLIRQQQSRLSLFQMESRESVNSSITRDYDEPSFYIQAEIEMRYLSPDVIYEIAFVIMLPPSTSQMHKETAICSHLICKPSHDAYLPRLCNPLQKHDLHDKPRNEWIRLSVGQYSTDIGKKLKYFTSDTDTEKKLIFRLEIEMHMVKIQGVIITPMATSTVTQNFPILSQGL